MRELFQLFMTFLKIGLFTFGGGFAMIPLIERAITDNTRWGIRKAEFVDLLTLAQTVPGPIALNVAVFIGYKAKGYAGIAAATLGIVIPSFVIILIIATLFADIRHNPVVDAAFRGMRPAVVALIIVPVLSLSKGLRWPLLGVIIATALAVWKLGWSPIYMLPVAAVGGILWTLYIAKKSSK
ncbi:MAG: chromate transporter [Alistipes sp.]